MFKNRIEAATMLAEKLLSYKERPDTIILAIPRGGIPVGATIAKILQLPMDIVLTKKIGHPYNPEFAIGALSLESVVLGKDAENVSKNYIDNQIIHLRENLQKRYDTYYQGLKRKTLTNKTVILTDDGIATGNTIIATINLIAKERPSKIIIAVPVSSISAFNKIKNTPHVDQMIALEQPADFYAVGQYYKDFSPVKDSEAIKLFKEFSN
ncbi:Phosphoribosyl transferase domain-containing protein [Zhouia amylolytica]|uniref:Phosphoribosyl transferase domain-containing protein n=1 Tax=Zhouia amylolytica TaxID=376730 RepID=A0A1I6V4B2_9FLAO|nr:phosphoribosyltransferase family protein [Zhouia amylolytica]MCQ0110040.1 phosphoribosyltransferase [Zhouia amylolytica]SFT08540.1 Phosphoribosyl transferase domain-containing protein [Zhouia amylolytica]